MIYQMAEMALVENIQRENWKCRMKKQKLCRIINGVLPCQSIELALRVGKLSSAIANKIRLLQLDENIQNAVSLHIRSQSVMHCALLGLDSKQQKMLDTIVKKGLNVSQTKAVKQEKLPKEERKR